MHFNQGRGRNGDIYAEVDGGVGEAKGSKGGGGFISLIKNIMDEEIKTDRESEVSRALGKLEITAEGLAEEVSSIESRLSGVVNGGGLAAGKSIGDGTKPPEFQTELASKINNLVENIRNSSNRLTTLRNRIEL